MFSWFGCNFFIKHPDATLSRPALTRINRFLLTLYNERHMCVCVCVFVIDTRRQHPRATYTHSPESLLLFLTFIFKHIFFRGPFFLLLFFIRMIHNAGPNLDRRLLGRLTEESLQESFAGTCIRIPRPSPQRERERGRREIRSDV